MDRSKAYKVYNSLTLIVKEIINVRFDELSQTDKRLPNLENDLVDLKISKPSEGGIGKVSSIDTIKWLDTNKASYKL